MTNQWAAYLNWKAAFFEAIDTRLYPEAWLDRQILSGRVQFWASEGAAALTELRVYPSGVADIHGLVAAGNMQEIIAMVIPQAEAWARAMGCSGAIIESREGWSKALKASGYAPYQIALRKEF